MDSKYTISDKQWQWAQERKNRMRAEGKGWGYNLVRERASPDPHSPLSHRPLLVPDIPCQSFSLAGHMLGFEDKKNGNLFFVLARLIEAKKPRVIFLENVKNLVSHNHGETFRIIQETLENIGYHIGYRVLNAAEYADIPQGRERECI